MMRTRRSEDLVGESCTTLIASSLEYLSAVRGSHSLAEAVFLTSLSLLGLICSEHNRTSFYTYTKYSDLAYVGA